MSPRVIVHAIPGRSVHHAVPMILSFHQHAAEMGIGDAVQIFVLYGVGPDGEERFRGLGPSPDRILFRPEMNLDPSLFALAGKNARFIFHSAFFSGIWDGLRRRPDVLDRTAIVFWGGELKPVLRRVSPSFKSFLRRPIKFSRWLWRRYRLQRDLQVEGFVLRRLGAVGTLTPGEMEIIERQFGPCGNYQPMVFHTHPRNIPLLTHGEKGGTIRVIVGNSAHSGSRHLDILPALGRFRDELIRLTCPLAYPRETPYKSEVIAAGERIFGPKFEPITKLISLDDYHRILDDADVFVLNAWNQQGLYGIYYELLRGKKIYLSPFSPVFRMLALLGIRVFDIREISRLSFTEFGALSEEDRLRNAEIAGRYFSLTAALERWRELFARLEGGDDRP